MPLSQPQHPHVALSLSRHFETLRCRRCVIPSGNPERSEGSPSRNPALLSPF